MIPWSLREVPSKRWRQAQEHEAHFWIQPNALPPQQERVARRYAGLLEELDQQGQVGGRILEVGSGPTCVSARLRNRFRVFADPLMTLYRPLCADAVHGHFVATVGEQLPFAEASFDAVFSFNVIDHVFSPARFVSELGRVLRPGGLVVLGVYTHPRLFAAVRTLLERGLPWARELPHPFFFSRHSLLHLLQHCGLQVERVVCVYAPNHIPALHRQDWVSVARKPAGLT